ncbi:metallophosphoesterase family protein [Salinilacihabitans rarus]|uniref:metallophosphoesterase family protein n=1 Tax=Salinilacihabitans rarus TaxID=2961596 RepID=UPI0020C8ED39|nr:metallophosphoesterase family protein [Salinilacihabitans rarus]
MELALISDTHVPERATSIPEPFRERIAAADHVIHAGDFETPDVLEEVRDLASDLTAVHGNADPAGIGLPAVADVAVDGVTFVVTHGTIDPVESAVYGHDGLVMRDDDWLNAIADTARARTRAWDGEGIVGIGGHSHRVEDEVHDGVRVLNPGSATGAEPAEVATMMTVDVDDGAVDVTVHEA